MVVRMIGEKVMTTQELVIVTVSVTFVVLVLSIIGYQLLKKLNQKGDDR